MGLFGGRLMAKPNRTRSSPTRRKVLRLAAAGAAAAGVGAPLHLFLARARPRRNIILIVADAMRADVLGCLGYTRPVNGSPRSITPFLDSLAARGALFERAVAASSWTPLSVGAILYDVSPACVYYAGGPYGTGLKVDAAGAPIPERLRTLGYHTMAIVANPILDQDVLRRGFDDFRFLAREEYFRKSGIEEAEIVSRGGTIVRRKASGKLINIELARSLRSLRKSEKFFLYLHYNDTHEPYTSPRHLGVEIGLSIFPEKNITTTSMHRWRHGDRDDIRADCTFDEGLNELRKSYDIAARYTDIMVKEMLGTLDEAGLLSDSLVIFTSDHGEEFMDGEVPTDADIGHARNLTQPSIATPLVICAPGADPMRIPQPVSNARVINDCIERWSDPRHGPQVLGAALAGGAREAIFSYLNFNGFHGISCIEGNRKLYLKLDDRKTVAAVTAFRLGGPNGIEKASQELGPEDVAAVLEKLDASPAHEHSLDRATSMHLRALGYLN